MAESRSESITTSAPPPAPADTPRPCVVVEAPLRQFGVDITDVENIITEGIANGYHFRQAAEYSGRFFIIFTKGGCQ